MTTRILEGDALAYYNEIDPFAAQWLRNLIAAGHIAPGDVDERSILEVRPDELRGYTQCHFFAGIGGWSYALRLAGWPDDRPVWTGSCPCQPFSVAGAQCGSDDERHLWPAFNALIRECRPAAVYGEQVAGASGLAWLDHVFADLEESGYAAAAANLCAAGAGAPHIRQRLYWVADAGSARTGRDARTAPCAQALSGIEGGEDGLHDGVAFVACGADGNLADATDERHFQRDARAHRRPKEQSERLGDACGLDDAGGEGLERHGANQAQGGRHAPVGSATAPSPLNAWADLEWITCSDGKARPTKPGLFPLAHGVPGRVGRLRAYGNAIVPQVAAAFISAGTPT